MDASIFSQRELETIKSKSLYWDEVVRRPGGGDILRAEFAELYRECGLKLLWAVKKYTERCDDTSDKQKTIDLLTLGLLQEKNKTSALLAALELAKTALLGCGSIETWSDNSRSVFSYDTEDVATAIAAIAKATE